MSTLLMEWSWEVAEDLTQASVWQYMKTNFPHYSKAYGVEDNSNTFWQVNAGPDIRVSYKTESVYCNIYTRGRSVSLPDRYVTGTVPDISNPVDISTGNIYLKAGYHQDVSLNVTYGRARSNKTYASIRLAGAVELNEITLASWYAECNIHPSAEQEEKSQPEHCAENQL